MFFRFDIRLYVCITFHKEKRMILDFFKFIENIKMNKKMRTRITHILGMKNYSHLLRNSDHMINYIRRGNWISNQTEEHGEIYKHLITNDGNIYKLLNDSVRNKDDYNLTNDYFEFVKDAIKRINTFPSTLKPNVAENRIPIYNFIERKNIIT